MKKITIRVLGMSCGHCEMRVTKGLMKIPGVKKVVASAKEANAIIDYDENKVNLDAIKAAIVETGYDVK